ncbi:nucleotidyltransferase family protein [Alkalicoccus daliensis]|uniref:Nucleotidyltransferase family protein n=1 Tax=Alkalicoccus daliensis TaxID=745820 RepID=A0A1G9Z924_9BACI|nr:hypothetical protein SAMN04488053_10112 [Alkalicoccus daliensis]
METKGEILHMIRNDAEMMKIIKCVRELELPDCWVCAGLLRAKIWDVLHDFSERTPLADVDVIYFDEENTLEATEKRWKQKLRSKMPHEPWSVKNQARMHKVNNISPYASATDAISKFPETATALGIKLNAEDELILTVPWGIEDAVKMKVRPTPFFEETEERMQIYRERVQQKDWKSKWGKLEVVF